MNKIKKKKFRLPISEMVGVPSEIELNIIEDDKEKKEKKKEVIIINVEVKYYGKPVMGDKKTGKVIKYLKEYTIEEYDDKKEKYSESQATIRKEITQIFKRHKGIYSIRFYVNGVNEK